jgi:hypothetical protein
MRVFFLPAKRKRKTQEDSVSKDFFYKKNGESLALCVPLPFMIHVRGAVGPVVFC